MPLHRHAGEQQLQVESHHLFQRHGGVHRLGLVVAQFNGQPHEARQIFLRYLHPRKLLLPRFRITDQGGNVQTQIADEREGMCRIHRKRCEHRENGVLEIGVHPFLLAAVEFGVID